MSCTHAGEWTQGQGIAHNANSISGSGLDCHSPDDQEPNQYSRLIQSTHLAYLPYTTTTRAPSCPSLSFVKLEHCLRHENNISGFQQQIILKQPFRPNILQIDAEFLTLVILART